MIRNAVIAVIAFFMVFWVLAAVMGNGALILYPAVLVGSVSSSPARRGFCRKLTPCGVRSAVKQKKSPKRRRPSANALPPKTKRKKNNRSALYAAMPAERRAFFLAK